MQHNPFILHKVSLLSEYHLSGDPEYLEVSRSDDEELDRIKAELRSGAMTVEEVRRMFAWMPNLLPAHVEELVTWDGPGAPVDWIAQPKLANHGS